jgi:hypothetical protein
MLILCIEKTGQPIKSPLQLRCTIAAVVVPGSIDNGKSTASP